MTTNKRGFNTANLVRLARFGPEFWAWKPDQTRDGVLELFGPGGVRTGAYGGPPRRYTDDSVTPETAGAKVPRDLVATNSDPSATIAQKALDDRWRALRKVATTAADTRLAPQAKHDDLVETAQASVVLYATRWAMLRGILERLDGKRSDIFDPKPAGADLPLDIEIRARVGRMDEAGYLNVLSRLLGSEQDSEEDLEEDQAEQGSEQPLDLAATLLALRRDPLLSVVPRRDLILRAWLTDVETKKGEDVEDYRAARETNTWALGLVKALAHECSNWSVSGTAGALDRYALFKILQPLNALELCDFTPADVQAFEAKASNDALRAKEAEAAAAARRPVAA